MTTIEIFAIGLLAAAIHGSFQLSMSVLTIMGGHAFSKKTSMSRVLQLVTSFIFGAVIMVGLLLSTIALLIDKYFRNDIPLIVWAVTCGLTVGIGAAVWVFYYRRKKSGTELWIPRNMAIYLSTRAKATKMPGEAFGLGLSSVISEILFAVGPLVITALLLQSLKPELQIVMIISYSLIVCLPLLIILVLVGSGRSLAKIQRWRETNKGFIQFAAGSGLIILAIYLYVETVVTGIDGLGVFW